jgi:hypothetical protein
LIVADSTCNNTFDIRRGSGEYTYNV